MLCALALHTGHADGGTDAFPRIPTEGILAHGSWQLHGSQASHQITTAEGHTWCFPFVGGVRLGLFDRGEFGITYGREVALEGKVQFIQEEAWLPAVTFGARGLLASQEAHLYSTADSAAALYRGEVFSVLGKALPGRGRVHLGLSAIPALDSGSVAFFYGLQQSPGWGFTLLYEGFARQQNWHHDIALAWQYKGLRLAVGALEVQRWIYEDGELGFSAAPHGARADAWRSPGIHAHIALTSRMLSGEHISTQARLQENERRMQEQRLQVEELQLRLDRLEVLSQETEGPGLDSVALREESAEALLNTIVAAFRSDAWEPHLLRRMQDSLVESGEVAHRVLARVAVRESSAPEHRLAALRIMGGSRRDRFVLPLSQILAQPNPVLQREAALALGRIGTLHAQETLRAYSPKASPELRKTIQELLKVGPRTDGAAQAVPAQSTNAQPSIPAPSAPPAAAPVNTPVPAAAPVLAPPLPAQ